jgi:hypothetical protein
MHPGMLQRLHNFDLLCLEPQVAQVQQMHLLPGNLHQILPTGYLSLMNFLYVLNVGMQQQTTTVVNFAMQVSIGSDAQLIEPIRILINP